MRQPDGLKGLFPDQEAFDGLGKGSRGDIRRQEGRKITLHFRKPLQEDRADTQDKGQGRQAPRLAAGSGKGKRTSEGQV